MKTFKIILLICITSIFSMAFASCNNNPLDRVFNEKTLYDDLTTIVAQSLAFREDIENLAHYLFFLETTGEIAEGRTYRDLIRAANEHKLEIAGNIVRWGETTIRLPKIEGMRNIYTIPHAKIVIDRTGYSGNTIFAFYVSDEVYSQIDYFGEFEFDGHLKIFAANALKDVPANRRQFVHYVNSLQTLLYTDWQDTPRTRYNWDFSAHLPLLFERYSIHQDVETFLTLMRLIDENGYELFLIASMNMALINNRIINLVHYKYYDGEESIKKARAKNNYLVLRFMSKNQ